MVENLEPNECKERETEEVSHMKTVFDPCCCVKFLLHLDFDMFLEFGIV